MNKHEERVSREDVERLTGQTYKSLTDRYDSAMRVPEFNSILTHFWGDLSRLDQGKQVTISRSAFDTILVEINKIDRK